MLKGVIAALLIGIGTAAHAVSIFPNQVTVSGKPGSVANIQIKVFGHPTPASIEFVKTTNLKLLDDKVIYRFDLGVDQHRVLPITIVIPEHSTEYYLCAVLSQSQSMRLRVCTAVRVLVKA